MDAFIGPTHTFPSHKQLGNELQGGGRGTKVCGPKMDTSTFHIQVWSLDDFALCLIWLGILIMEVVVSSVETGVGNTKVDEGQCDSCSLYHHIINIMICLCIFLP